MKHALSVYNTLTRKKEPFVPIKEQCVGIYGCGPTVYGDPHLGHARPAITFDLVFRYLKHLGYKVRYVRNITDVGHLEMDRDEGEDKIAKKARLEQLEPMEVVQYYSDRYYHFMEMLNVERPSIEPRASGHIIEQITMIEKILEAGFGYEVDGSVYFDVELYNARHPYGKLSGRKLDELMTNSRELEGQAEKRNPFDFALWKKAQPEHIMRWPSPWSDGFPGWHLECSAMGTKYLGEEFDIHGGGMDLMFPHHECEIAQSQAANGKEAVKYWMHNNMITINGQKMGKSLGNAVSLEEFFTGNHPLLDQGYSPMTIRFFILQAHYRSTLDFSNEALQAAEKGLKKLMAGWDLIKAMFQKEFNGIDPKSPHELGEDVESSPEIKGIIDRCYEAMNDDFNTATVIAQLFEATRLLNQAKAGTLELSKDDIAFLFGLFQTFMIDILGLKDESPVKDLKGVEGKTLNNLMDLILDLRKEARASKDWATSDQIRDALASAGIRVKDTKEGSAWEITEP